MAYQTNRLTDDEQKYLAHQVALKDIRAKQADTRQKLANLERKSEELSDYANKMNNFVSEVFYSQKGLENNYYDTESYQEYLKFSEDIQSTLSAGNVNLENRRKELRDLERKQKLAEEELIKERRRELAKTYKRADAG